MNAIDRVLSDSGVRRLFDVLDGGGEEARIAGGAVRDALIGRLPAEVDFATTAVPDEVIRRAGEAGVKAVPTGVSHGTVTLVIGGRPFEVTTLRRDVETDGRHAVVAFGRNWAEDARRRDFTINGLFLDRDGQVHDFVGGRRDLDARRVRFIGDARTRIREDYLRILRFFRFFAAYGQGLPDEEALSAAVAERAGLHTLSRERIRAELLKFLVTPRAPEAAEIMAESGLLSAAIGGTARPVRLKRVAEIEAALGLVPDPVLRLAALSLFTTDSPERLREGLRLSNEEFARLRAMSGAPVLTPELPEQDRKAALYLFGERAFHDRILLAWADSPASADDAAWRDLFDLPARWMVPKFPIAARDIIARGVEPGPRLGKLLRRAEMRWIASCFPQAHEALDNLLNDLVG